MDIFEKYNIRPVTLFKSAGALLVGLVVVLFAVQMIGGTVRPFLADTRIGLQNVVPGIFGGDAVSESGAPSYGGKGGNAYGMDGVDLSYRNVAGTSLPYPGVPPAGDTAEAFEVKSYDVIIESRDFLQTCASLADLKAKDYVIFQNANEHDRGCDYAFKVKNANVEEILGLLKSFDPKEFSQNTYTIQQLITDYTSEVELLEKKGKSIDETLANAIKAYDEITDVATRSQNAESLARIIDSKIQIIERLTQQRISINAQLDQLSRAKAEQLDRLAYTTFHVNVYESKFVDGEELKDSWKAAIRDFVRNINKTVQDVTINLIALMFVAMQFVLYFFILLFVAKYVWRLAVKVWKK